MGKEYQINADTILWNDFIKGNNEAFRIIYNNYVRILFNYGCHFTHDQALVKDCIHDVFIDLSKYRSGLSPTNNIKLYLFKSLKCSLIRSLGKRKAFGNIDDPEKLPFYYSISYEDEIAESENEQQRYQQLNKAMSTLSPRQKEAIYLRFVSGLSYDELGKVMQVNYQSARNLVHRGLENLRECYPKDMVCSLSR